MIDLDSTTMANIAYSAAKLDVLEKARMFQSMGLPPSSLVTWGITALAMSMAVALKKDADRAEAMSTVMETLTELVPIISDTLNEEEKGK